MERVIQGSRATPEFKEAVAAFLRGQDTDRLLIESYAPPVKVQRVLAQLMDAEPALEIEQVTIRGRSGCSDFVGSVEVQTTTGSHVFDFAWCCRWRAEAEGYVDYFGFPDQMRAAHEFGWRCFRHWEQRN
jgi:hypothetical protein